MQKVLYFFLFLTLVSGHAVLKSPKAWNTAASKSNPCGGGSAPTVAAANWVAGSTVNLSWQVIAGDGQGPVSVTVNAGGGTTFTGQATQVGNGNSVKTFTFPFKVPDVTCTGANGLCSVQVKSSSNWFSCTSVKITSANTPTPPPTTKATQAGQTTQATRATQATQQTRATQNTQQTRATQNTQQTRTTQGTSKPDSTVAPPNVPRDEIQEDVCQIVTGLKFCTSIEGKNVSISTGDTIAQVDATAKSTHSETLANPLVLVNANATGCDEALKEFQCASAFPTCGTTLPKEPICQNVADKCGIQDSHKTLFQCQSDIQNVSSGVKIFCITSLLLALLL